MRLLSSRRLTMLALLGWVTCATAAPFAAADGWVEIAHFDGFQVINAAQYQSGVGTLASSNYAAPASAFSSLGSNFTVGVVMGGFTDYFRPAAATWNLADMLSSNSRHAWAATANGPFVVPTYFSGGLGGSSAGWPSAQDGRVFLPFWGSNAGQPGACCQDIPGGALGWGQAFTMYLQPLAAVPESSTLGLMLTGLAALAGLAGVKVLRRRAKARQSVS